MADPGDENSAAEPHPPAGGPARAPRFFRCFGTTVLIAGLISRKLPSGFADPVASGDLISLGPAYVAFIGQAGKPLLLPVRIFNIARAADLLLAMVLGPALIHNPGDFGLAYTIPTMYVPPASTP